MVVREPGLLAADPQQLIRRLMQMKVSWGRGWAGRDYVWH
jgi:hypothetical protein